MLTNPYDGCMYYVDFGKTIKKICYKGNVRPDAIALADTLYGPSPLTVHFDASESTDPNSDPLSYHWDFGDGNTSSEISPAHIYSVNHGDPQMFEVKLTVTDTVGESRTDKLNISLNNTPPRVHINSFAQDYEYSVKTATILPLAAEVSDREHDNNTLSYEWQTFLHHNDHFHAEVIDHSPETSAHITPIGCEAETITIVLNSQLRMLQDYLEKTVNSFFLIAIMLLTWP